MINFQLDYKWEPFLVRDEHLNFVQHTQTRLEQGRCNHWGAAIYKWEGFITTGEQKGRIGILIGETQDIRARIKQYVSGTQETGNKYWREEFLTKGDIQLYILKMTLTKFDGHGESPV